jgi:hypothetical protein
MASTHSHGASSGDTFDLPDRTRKLLYLAAGLLAIATVAGMVVQVVANRTCR